MSIFMKGPVRPLKIIQPVAFDLSCPTLGSHPGTGSFGCPERHLLVLISNRVGEHTDPLAGILRQMRDEFAKPPAIFRVWLQAHDMGKLVVSMSEEVADAVTVESAAINKDLPV